jgi:hypothetical protein
VKTRLADAERVVSIGAGSESTAEIAVLRGDGRGAENDGSILLEQLLADFAWVGVTHDLL